MANERSLTTCGPSFEEIIGPLIRERTSEREHRLVDWVGELREYYLDAGGSLTAPLPLERLLQFAHEVGTQTGEEGEPYDDLEEFVASAHERALTEWLTRAAEFIPVRQRVVAAVEHTSTWWPPGLREQDATMAAAIERLLRHARANALDENAFRQELQHAEQTGEGLPPSSPPPPYVGHFCGAVHDLIQGLLAPPGLAELATCLSYATVTPAGPVPRAAGK